MAEITKYATTPLELSWRDVDDNDIKREKLVRRICFAAAIIIIIGSILSSYFCATVASSAAYTAVPATLGPLLVVLDCFYGATYSRAPHAHFMDEEEIVNLLTTKNFEAFYEEFHNPVDDSFLGLNRLVQKGYMEIKDAENLHKHLRLYHENKGIKESYEREVQREVFTKHMIDEGKFPAFYVNAYNQIEAIKHSWNEIQGKICNQYRVNHPEQELIITYNVDPMPIPYLAPPL